MKEIRATALVSQKLNCLFSFGTLIFVFSNVESVIVIFSIIALNESWFSCFFLLYPAMTWSYFLFILQLNQQVLQTLRKIIQCLGSTKQYNQYSDDKCKCKSITLHELQLYLPYFKMTLFSMKQIDFRFVLGAALFAMNYITFFLQTNT